MVHVLEHIENPAELLRNLLQHAAPEALLLVEVPAWKANPFALMISDHASHFTDESLQMVVNASGWQTKMVSGDWVPKEVSLVGCNARSVVAAASKLDASQESEALQEAVRWLSEVMADARRIAETSAGFGLFGSAIAATWLYQGMSDKVRFSSMRTGRGLDAHTWACPFWPQTMSRQTRMYLSESAPFFPNPWRPA
jgi:hypothetical protein